MNSVSDVQSAALVVRHRFVDFGTVFRRCGENRESEEEYSPGQLCENEIAVDIGGVCHSSEAPNWVFDHHFPEADYPSAAAAVLSNAQSIQEKFRTATGPVWIVTHKSPDFDALCSSYLVRAILDGALEFEKQAELNLPTELAHWTDPRVDPRAKNGWAVLLAAYASRIDNGKKINVARQRRLHSILYAALERKRDARIDGLAKLFDAARDAIRDNGYNPIYDSIFDSNSGFSAELELLELESARYERDVERARISMVRVPVTKDFASSYGRLRNQSLLQVHADGELLVSRGHLDAMACGDNLRTLDAIWIEQPESMLFKEWAREDYSNSPMGRGFTFTAVRNTESTLEWFFSLDPEKAQGAHLYPVWAKLQRQEAEARRRLGLEYDPSTKVRLGFEKRAEGAESWFRGDPWFDGGNYKCTIIVSPGEGTVIDEDSLSVLNSHEGLTTLRSPMAVVQSLLEDSVFAPFEDLVAEETGDDGKAEETRIKVWQYPIDEPYRPDHPSITEPTLHRRVSHAVEIEPLYNHYLFAEIRLHLPASARGGPAVGQDLNNRKFAEQIARKIWPLLERKGVDTVPSDFSSRHVLINPHRVAVWSRRGVAVATVEGDENGALEACQIRSQMQDIWRIAHGLNELRDRVGEPEYAVTPEERRSIQELIRLTARMQFLTSLPEGLPLRRFVEASRFESVIDPLNHLIENIYQADERAADRERSLTFGLVGIAIAALAIPPFVKTIIDMDTENLSWFVSLPVTLLAGGLAFLLIRRMTRIPQTHRLSGTKTRSEHPPTP